MAVLRIHKKQQNFLILDKTCLSETKLSWGAKGLHAYLMSMPDNWKVKVESLQKCARNGRDAVRGYLSELEEAGYIQKSHCRDDQSGRFGGIEYLVLEIPEPKTVEVSPETEKPSSVIPEAELPATGNPLTVIPAPEKPTLINNKYNNYLNNKGLNKTAANRINAKTRDLRTQPKAAAVMSSPEEAIQNLEQSLPDTQKLYVLSPIDSLIGEALTTNQIKRVQDLMENLDIQDKERLGEEVCYCLLNKTHFTGCGKDFGRKLNAIRAVILRGNWQTPFGMMLEDEKPKETQLSELSMKLNHAQADLRHFRGLQALTQGDLKQQYEKIIATALLNIKKLEQALEQQKSGAPLAM